MGSRISDMRLTGTGEPLEADKILHGRRLGLGQ
jgi:hypothetical protein